ncbi:glycosidase [Bradyrhizobium sp. USDA 4452]
MTNIGSKSELTGLTMETSKSGWWKGAVTYEIVPHSFQDSDGDGKGDLRGLSSRLDYLQWLGVDTLWLTPIYPSPFLDLGYDIADFCAVDPSIGSLGEFDLLVRTCHEAGIRIVLDLVPNHTSDKHTWFADSRSSRNNAKADWYIWAGSREVRRIIGAACSAAAPVNGARPAGNTTTIFS